MKDKKVAVLMSTYNGERYLKEQMDSVYNQKDIELYVVVRDDGSKDKTAEILRSYSLKYTNLTLLLEGNCGAEMSFFKLCRYAVEKIHADYYAFCDQDDVWEPNKLAKAIQKLEEYDRESPNLYFSNLKMVDEHLNYIRDMFQEGEVIISKKMALLQVFTYGCTCVFNKKALVDMCCETNNKAFHDVWAFMVCAFLGNVYYDSNSYILYRQHSSNLSGVKATGLRKLFLRVKKLQRKDLEHRGEIIAQQFISNYGERLNAEDYKRIKTISTYRHSFKDKLRLLFSNDYKTGKIGRDTLNFIRTLINHV